MKDNREVIDLEIGLQSYGIDTWKDFTKSFKKIVACAWSNASIEIIDDIQLEDMWIIKEKIPWEIHMNPYTLCWFCWRAFHKYNLITIGWHFTSLFWKIGLNEGVCSMHTDKDVFRYYFSLKLINEINIVNWKDVRIKK